MQRHIVEVGAPYAPEPVENILEHNAKVLFDRHTILNRNDAPILDYESFKRVSEVLTSINNLDERMLYQGIQRYLMEVK